jgi:hypothetical protein
MTHSLPRTLRGIINSVFGEDEQNERQNELIVDIGWTCLVLGNGFGTALQVLGPSRTILAMLLVKRPLS